MEITIILIIIFMFTFVAFIGLALFFPEWLGIQGKVAKEIEESGQKPSSENSHLP